jgi:hypothetical protein
MMFKVHGYVGETLAIKRRLEHIPRTGDVVRLSGTVYAKVLEVCWCMDEYSDEGQRVNIMTDTARILHPVRSHPMLGAMEKPGATTRAGSVPRALPGAVSITDRLKEGGRHDPHPAV